MPDASPHFEADQPPQAEARVELATEVAKFGISVEITAKLAWPYVS